ncbi:MAG TPA: hypothetical protein VLF69_04255 [Candidatus Saccharimonadales bacterium]|nr:hypothetical protein [Candidatus Saccharimonadales bacterium]
MPLIRVDYSEEHLPENALKKLNTAVFNASADLFRLDQAAAQDKISIFNTPFGSVDHSTASAEIEIRAKISEFDHPTLSRDEVRQGYLKHYEVALLPCVRELGLKAPIIFTITFEDWQVIVLSAEGTVPN